MCMCVLCTLCQKCRESLSADRQAASLTAFTLILLEIPAMYLQTESRLNVCKDKRECEINDSLCLHIDLCLITEYK